MTTTEEIKAEFPLKVIVLENGTKLLSQVKPDININYGSIEGKLPTHNELGQDSIVCLVPMEMMYNTNPLTGESMFMLLEYIAENMVKDPEILIPNKSILIIHNASENMIEYYNKCLNSLKNRKGIGQIKDIREAIVEKLSKELKQEYLDNLPDDVDENNVNPNQSLEEFLKNLKIDPTKKMN